MNVIYIIYKPEHVLEREQRPSRLRRPGEEAKITLYCENHTKYTSKLYGKMYFLNVIGGIDRAGSGYGQVAGTCECDNEPSCSTK